jgi:hypothetical protein
MILDSSEVTAAVLYEGIVFGVSYKCKLDYRQRQAKVGKLVMVGSCRIKFGEVNRRKRV